MTGQLSVRVEDLSLISDAMARLRAAPPSSLLGRAVAFADLALEDPPVDAVRLLGDGVRVIVRPSGTEPKLKAYLETVVPVHDDAGLIAARGRGEDELDQLRAEMSAWAVASRTSGPLFVLPGFCSTPEREKRSGSGPVSRRRAPRQPEASARCAVASTATTSRPNATSQGCDPAGHRRRGELVDGDGERVGRGAPSTAAAPAVRRPRARRTRSRPTAAPPWARASPSRRPRPRG